MVYNVFVVEAFLTFYSKYKMMVTGQMRVIVVVSNNTNETTAATVIINSL